MPALCQGISGDARGAEETLELRRAHEEEIKAMEAAIADMQKSWEEKLKEAQARLQQDNATPDWSSVPHITLLTEDPLLSGSLSFKLPAAPEKLTVGKKEGDKCPLVCLSGSGLSHNHCYLQLEQQQQEGETGEGDSAAALYVLDGAGNTFVNGKETEKGEKIKLHSGDRVVIGQNYVFLVFIPSTKTEKETETETTEAKEGETYKAKGQTREELLSYFTYDVCMQELACNQGTVSGMEETQQQMQKETMQRTQYKQKLQEAQQALQKQKEVNK
ncbi:kinesin motor domain cointaining protein, putative [Eimeria mitis]|uniref:Kinesin motor domain cointaining protein, putative n=1 Tax=Eimeria mitis TaxID=44415 RepID=U6JZF9_9EIME|nr:kinesin motor domain cointaining protein, putative [Eimeria mitis]CDJ30850.1 kinesin motor domain cointaining protein, putative [Eimeria mitis]